MKFTFISEQEGLKVEMNFEAEFIYDIEEMFKQFLRGTGFSVEDEDLSEECMHKSAGDHR
ncbi:MAG: hypothetical protein NBV66_08970 [Burkholderiaceae bacterium]|nr:hypothetical protein [Burkholderiaceae bacterium]